MGSVCTTAFRKSAVNGVLNWERVGHNAIRVGEVGLRI